MLTTNEQFAYQTVVRRRQFSLPSDVVPRALSGGGEFIPPREVDAADFPTGYPYITRDELMLSMTPVDRLGFLVELMEIEASCCHAGINQSQFLA